jgi:tetratricopeptide (TPR) repeat protein
MRHMVLRPLLAFAAAATLAAPASPLAPSPDAQLAKALAASSCGAGEGTGGAASASRIVLVPGLTPAHMPVSQIAEAQAFFDQGLGQMFGFDFDEAEKSFKRAAALDPACAMCAWGEALAIGPYVNSGPIDAPTIARARVLVAKALAGKGLSERDRELALAAYARYEPGGRQSGVHGERYADTMLRLAARWPDDDFVQIMAAEAVMDAQPWDYWEAGGKLPKGRAGEAIRLVETVLARSPDDPQAIHLLIHLTEASANPARAAGPAARLGGLAPAAPHMVHMPSHTWYRIGRYDEAIAANKAAIAADEAYARQVGEDPQNYGYFSHHTHFLASSATQTGDAAAALAAADALDRSITADVAARSPRMQNRLMTAIHARARFLTPQQFLALPAPDARLSRLLIVWHAARAEAYAQLGDVPAAKAELAKSRAAYAAIPRATVGSGSTTRGGGNDLAIAAIADGVARGRIAEAEGRTADALRAYRAAEAVETNLAYFEPPLWPTPVAVYAGRLRLEQGDMAAATADFRRALAQRPGNALAEAGLQAARG